MKIARGIWAAVVIIIGLLCTALFVVAAPAILAARSLWWLLVYVAYGVAAWFAYMMIREDGND